MVYSFTLITTKPDCEALINIAKQEKEDLEFKKLSIERKRKAATSTTVEVETEFQTVSAEIAAYDTVIAALPDGTSKDDAIFKKKKLEYRLLLLNERRNNYGVVSLLDKEFDVGCIEKQIDEANSFIDSVTQHMNNL